MIKLKEILESDVNLSELVERLKIAIENIVKHGPVERPVAGAVVINEEGKLLVVYSDFANQGWFCPKGGVDFGETTVEAAKRESFEESGVKATQLATNQTINLISNYEFENVLGFGSPRYNKEGPEISQCAYNLMKQAANDIGIEDAVFEKNKIFIFDELADKIKVTWFGGRAIVYHIFAYKGNDTGSSHESIAQKWLPIEEVKKLPKIHSHLKQILRVLDRDRLVGKVMEISKKL